MKKTEQNEKNISNLNKVTMKKMFMVLAATLICGAFFLTSCNKEKDLNVKEKIIGKWITADINGKPAVTNDKMVYNFISSTKAYLSASFSKHPEAGSPWIVIEEADVVVKGNTVTITCHPSQNTTSVQEFTITSINDNELFAKAKITVKNGDNVVLSEEGTLRLVKVNVDYGADIIGYWIGRMTSAESDYGDIDTHGWDFSGDGTFVYLTANAFNEMIESEDEYADYFVAGNLLCTRWKNVGEGQEEHREWWEITINGDNMYWTALRERADGTTYTATYEMTR